MFDEAQVSSVSLMVDGSHYVTLECSDFPYLGIWITEPPSCICLETIVGYLHQMDMWERRTEDKSYRCLDGKTGRRATRSGWNNNECHVRMRGEIQLRTRVYITRRRTMYKIVKSECLADKIYLMDVEAPRIARACQPGEFVIVKMDEVGERIR